MEWQKAFLCIAAVVAGIWGKAARAEADCYVNRQDQCAIVRLVNQSGQLINDTFVATVEEGALQPNESRDAILNPAPNGVAVDAFWDSGVGDNRQRIEWHGSLHVPMDACHVYVFYFYAGGSWQFGGSLPKGCGVTTAPPDQSGAASPPPAQPPSIAAGASEALRQEGDSLDAQIRAGQTTAAAALAQLDAMAASYNIPAGNSGWSAWRSRVAAMFGSSETYFHRQQQAQQQAQHRQTGPLQPSQQNCPCHSPEVTIPGCPPHACLGGGPSSYQAQQRAIETARQKAIAEFQAKQQAEREHAIAELREKQERSNEALQASQNAFNQAYPQLAQQARTEAKQESGEIAENAASNWKSPKTYAEPGPASQVELVDPFSVQPPTASTDSFPSPKETVTLPSFSNAPKKDLGTRITEAVVAALHSPRPENPLNYVVIIGEPKVFGHKHFLLPVRFSVPLANVTLISDGKRYKGRLFFYFVVLDAEGHQSEVQTRPVDIDIRPSEIDKARKRGFGYAATLLVSSGSQKLSTGLRDSASAEVSFVQKSLFVRPAS